MIALVSGVGHVGLGKEHIMAKDIEPGGWSDYLKEQEAIRERTAKPSMMDRLRMSSSVRPSAK